MPLQCVSAHNAVLNLLALGPHYLERKKRKGKGGMEGKGKEGNKVRGSKRQKRDREGKGRTCALLKLMNAYSFST